jgi:hypothetical protein
VYIVPTKMRGINIVVKTETIQTLSELLA